VDVNPNAGQRETRYYDSVEDAQAGYLQLMSDKQKKGYKPIKLAASNIGSNQAKVLAASNAATARAAAAATKPKKAGVAAKPKAQASTLHPLVQELVTYIYSEATNNLVNNVSATITEDGPLVI